MSSIIKNITFITIDSVSVYEEDLIIFLMISITGYSIYVVPLIFIFIIYSPVIL